MYPQQPGPGPVQPFRSAIRLNEFWLVSLYAVDLEEDLYLPCHESDLTVVRVTDVTLEEFEFRLQVQKPSTQDQVLAHHEA